MRPWKRPELALATLLSLSAGSSAWSFDGTNADPAAGRATLTPMEQLTQETAQQRWDRIKSRYQPMVTTPLTATVAPASVKPGAARPFPEETAATDQPTVGTAPLPDAGEEPAWIISNAPAETLEQPLQGPARTSTPFQPPAPVPVHDAGRSAVEPRVETADVPDVAAPYEAVGPFDAAEDVLSIAARQDPGLPPMPTGTAVRRAVRKMSEIQPFYDKQVDQDIREYADARAADYDVRFGSEEYQPRMFGDTAVAWEPTNFYHYPLYFEDAVLERYGHTYPFVVQPFVSVAKFSGQLLALPYQMTLDPVTKPMYALGWYRPGECAPKLKYQIPWNAQAAAVQAGVTTGMIFLIP